VTDKVVDASAVVALLFDEVPQENIVARLRDASLHAPTLVEFEVASACLKKMRASPGQRDALLRAFSLFNALSIALQGINFAETIALADRTKLSIYDASYLWLARAIDAELVTLDDKLARAERELRR
jgi:predicted nucleic acid-binding protein